MTGVLEARQKIGYIYSGRSEDSLLTDAFAEYQVKDIMIEALTTYAKTSVNEAITQLFMYDAGSLYIIDPNDQTLQGLVSRKDLLRSSIGQPADTPLGVIMTRMPNIIVIQPDQSILEAARLIAQHQVDSLPVVTANHEILGKISKTHIVNLLVDLCYAEE